MPAPLRVLIVHPELPVPGCKASGVAVVVDRLARSLQQREDIEVTVAALAEKPPEGATYAYRRLFGEAPQWLVKLLRTRPGRVILWPLLLNFVRLPDCDVLHFHGDDALFARRPRRRPTVRTMHGSSWRELQHTRSWRRKLWLAAVLPLEWLGRLLATRTLAIGSDTASLYRTPFRIGNSPAEGVFHPGVKTLRPTVFYNGWWRGRKRGEFLFRCFVDQVLPQFPDAELWFLADECPEHPAVRHFRGVADAELGKLYRQAWLVGYPSTYEGFGLVYLEAMASGTAVVASPNTGARDVIGDSQAGLLSDDDDFGAHLVALLDQPERRQAMASAGLERAREFSAESIASEHVRHYRELVQAAATRRNPGTATAATADTMTGQANAPR